MSSGVCGCDRGGSFDRVRRGVRDRIELAVLGLETVMVRAGVGVLGCAGVGVVASCRD